MANEVPNQQINAGGDGGGNGMGTGMIVGIIIIIAIVLLLIFFLPGLRGGSSTGGTNTAPEGGDATLQVPDEVDVNVGPGGGQ